MAISCIHLLERITGPRPSRVDRGAGIIRGVKVLGFSSSNGRRYTPECLKAAARLYEGKPVYCDHRTKDDEQRSSKDKLGKLFNVRFTSQGLYGDLLVLKSHPLTARLYEAAEDPRKHDFWGLSHDAEGEVDTVDGEQCVRRIVDVKSVDLVADPASTQGLFESKQASLPWKESYEKNCPTCGSEVKARCRCRIGNKWCRNGHQWHRCKVHNVVVPNSGHGTGGGMPGSCSCGIRESKTAKTYKGRGMKLREWFQKAKLLPIARKRIKQLFEAGGMDEDMPMYEADMDMDMTAPGVEEEPVSADPMGTTSPDPAQMDPTEALKQGLGAAFGAVIHDGTMDSKAKLARAKQLINAWEDLLATGEEVPEAEEEPADEVDASHDEPDGDESEEDDLFEGEDGEDGSSKGAADITEEECDEDRPMKESKTLKARNAQLEREIKIRDLLEAEDVKATAALRKALFALDDDDSRRELIREHKAASISKRIRSGVSGNGTERTAGQVGSTDDFVAAITRN